MWAMDTKRRIKKSFYAWVLIYDKRIQTPHYMNVSHCALLYLLLHFDTLCWQHFQALLWTCKLLEPYFVHDFYYLYKVDGSQMVIFFLLAQLS